MITTVIVRGIEDAQYVFLTREFKEDLIRKRVADFKPEWEIKGIGTPDEKAFIIDTGLVEYIKDLRPYKVGYVRQDSSPNNGEKYSAYLYAPTFEMALIFFRHWIKNQFKRGMQIKNSEIEIIELSEYRCDVFLEQNNSFETKKKELVEEGILFSATNMSNLEILYDMIEDAQKEPDLDKFF